MYSILVSLYNFGYSLCNYTLEGLVDILTYSFSIGDTEFSLFSILLPTGFLLYMGYTITKWIFDIIF